MLHVTLLWSYGWVIWSYKIVVLGMLPCVISKLPFFFLPCTCSNKRNVPGNSKILVKK